MSSMRNAVHRRQHRERGQLEGREKWGILEKHKDYSLRAKDYNLKKTKLQRLREKARNRNLDEFAFGMLSAQTSRKGRHGARDGAAATLSLDVVRLLKTQDAGYLRLASDKIRKQIQKLEQDVRLQDEMKQLLEDGPVQGQSNYSVARSGLDGDAEEGNERDGLDCRPRNKSHKVFFVDTLEEQRMLGIQLRRDNNERDNDDDGDDDDDDEGGSDGKMDVSFGQLQKRKNQRPEQTGQKSKKELQAEKRALKERRQAKRLKRRAEEVRKNNLQGLQNQYSELMAAERELDLQRGKMQNSVGGVNKHGLKWKIRERKR